MNKNKLKTIIQAFDKFDSFIIAGHQEPDGDCLCSQMALSSFLKRKGKKTKLVSAGPFSRPEIKDWEEMFSQALSKEDFKENTLVVITDCSSPERTGKLARQLEKFPSMVIDHHSSGEKYGDYRYID